MNVFKLQVSTCSDYNVKDAPLHNKTHLTQAPPQIFSGYLFKFSKQLVFKPFHAKEQLEFNVTIFLLENQKHF